jgi:ornithine decarboxylase
MAMPRSNLKRVSASPSILYDAPAVSRGLAAEDPVFCFSRPQLLAKLKEFRDGFPGEVSFAVKSNPTREVLETLSRGGLRHWDVASVREMEKVAAVCARPVFHYHNPVKSRREIADAYKLHGCRRFAVDCREELAKIGDVAAGDRKVEIAVRFVLPRERGSSAHDFSTKFGAPEHISVELLRDARARGFRPVLTFHPGSQSLEPHTYVRHIEAAARIAEQAGVTIGRLNVGGGFPANYLTSRAEPLSIFFANIRNAATAAFAEGKVPHLECEPGRGLVASSMSLLTQVKLVCTDGDDIFINDGVYGGLMEFMQVPDLQPPYRAIRDGELLKGLAKSWKVFGPTCDPLDVLPRRLDLPANLQEGDFIEFGNLGAYGIATTTQFNSYGEHQIVEVERALSI